MDYGGQSKFHHINMAVQPMVASIAADNVKNHQLK
jgi:hypothetical protein